MKKKTLILAGAAIMVGGCGMMSLSYFTEDLADIVRFCASGTMIYCAGLSVMTLPGTK